MPNTYTSANKKVTLITSTLVGVLVIGTMLWFADPTELLSQLQTVELPLLGLALGLLGFEALFSSLRIQHCANHTVPYKLAVYCNSIYIAWLLLLPVRLGELAGIAVFNLRLKMPLGSAITSVIVQRIYDILVLVGFLLILSSQTLLTGITGISIAALVFIGLVVVLWSLPIWLTCALRILYAWRRQRLLKRMFSILLQARTWYRHQSGRRAVIWLTGTTLGKWLFNLIAIVAVFSACGLDLDLGQMLVVAILMHFLGAIPIQSFGGVGVADVGLAAILVSLGSSPEQAVATSLVMRFVSLTFSGLFFSFSFLVLRPRIN